MASYEVLWKTSAEKELRDTDRKQVPRIVRAVEGLSDDPFPTGYRKLRGSERSYRIRVSDYRVVYQVDSKANQVVIYHVRHRQDAYRR